MLDEGGNRGETGGGRGGNEGGQAGQGKPKAKQQSLTAWTWAQVKKKIEICQPRLGRKSRFFS